MRLRDLKEMMVARGIWMLCVNDAWLCRVIATGVANSAGHAPSTDNRKIFCAAIRFNPLGRPWYI